MLNKIIHKVSWAIIIVAILLLGHFIWLLFYPYNVIEVKQVPFPVIEKTLKHGDRLEFVLDYCKYMNSPATIQSQFVDGVVVQLSQSITNVPTGCHNRIDNSVVIPKHLPIGKYVFRSVVNYKVNALRTIQYVYETEEFEIIDSNL